MSSALDDDTRRSLAAGRDTAGDMLRAAQKDLQKVFIVWLVGFIGTFYGLRLFVWPFLKDVTQAQMEDALAEEVVIIAQTPFDVILLQAKIALFVGLVVALPPFIYFSRDALKSRGMWPTSPVPWWKVGPIVVLGVGLFTAGVVYGYSVFFPFTFEFLARITVDSGFQPRYSIVMWAQFIFLLSVSFGLAAQLPLVMTALSYAEIVPYETFRDYWRHAVVAIFVFGALFSPPDPFTQIMWAFPLLVLYGTSLYLAKVVTTTKRASDDINLRSLVSDHWNVLAGTGVAGGVAVYYFYTRGGVEAINGVLANYSRYRLKPAGSALPVAPEVAAGIYAAVGALLVAGVAMLYFLARAVEAVSQAQRSSAATGDPESIDLSALDAEGVRAAPPEAFADLSEEEALAKANEAMDDDDPEKAQAILDRFDETEAEKERAEGEVEASTAEAAGAAGAVESGAGDETAETAPDDETGGGGGFANRASRASETFFSELNEGEEDDGEDDIGGYYHDVRFIFDSLTSKSFRIIAVFMAVLVSVFGWLYMGGIRLVKEDFLRRLPREVTNIEGIEVGIVALHPVEALIFEIKFATLVAAIAIVPLIAYYAWPALRERNFVYGRRQVIFGWLVALVLGLAGGFAFGYAFVAPSVISYLVADAVLADMVISYRITNFFWLIFFTTAGIGLLADIPVLMVLLNTAGVSYRSMRDRWREVTVGIMTFAALFTPASVSTMVGMTIPLMAAYGIGLGLLAVLTGGGRIDLSHWLGDPEAADANADTGEA